MNKFIKVLGGLRIAIIISIIAVLIIIYIFNKNEGKKEAVDTVAKPTETIKVEPTLAPSPTQTPAVNDTPTKIPTTMPTYTPHVEPTPVKTIKHTSTPGKGTGTKSKNPVTSKNPIIKSSPSPSMKIIVPVHE